MARGAALTLHVTPRSHYARKVRLLIDGLGLKVDLVDAGNVGAAQPIADNPLMRVPALIDDGQLVIDSDHIAAHVVRHHAPDDRFEVLTTDREALNLRAVMNGVMAAEVEIVLARRGGLDTAGVARFDKHLAVIEAGLSWLNAHAERFAGETYLGLHLVALWDHLALYDLVAPEHLAREHPALAAQVTRLSSLPYVSGSKPT